jgi:hemoglobin/transferrin/lactoferrin receptor protein
MRAIRTTHFVANDNQLHAEPTPSLPRGWTVPAKGVPGTDREANIMTREKDRLLSATACALALAAFSTIAAYSAAGRAQSTASTASSSSTTTDSTETAVTAPVVVEDSRTVVTPATDTPATITVSREEMDAKQVDNYDQIDRLAPGVSYNSRSESFNIRGLDASRVAMTIDGIPLPWVTDASRNGDPGVSGYSGGANTVDFSSLSQLDIVRGADSSVNGNGALGGTVALRTLDPEDILSGDDAFGGISKVSIDTTDRSWSINQALAGRAENTLLFVQGGYRNGHETSTQGEDKTVGTAFRSRANPADYDQTNFLAKIHQYVGDDTRLGLTGEIFTRDTDSTYYTVNAALPASAPRYQPGSYKDSEEIERKRVSGSYDFNSVDGKSWIDQANAVVYWQRQLLNDDVNAIRVSAPLGDFSRYADREETLYGLNGTLVKEFEAITSHKVSFGGNLARNEDHQYIAGEDTCDETTPTPTACANLHANQSDMPDVDGLSVGLFSQDEISLAQDIRLIPGVRFDWYQQKPQATSAYLDDNPAADGLPNESSAHKLSPKLRMEWDAATEVTLYGQWAQAFRAPTVNELYGHFGGVGTYLSIGNPDLKPETSNGFEIGSNLGSEKFGGSVSGYYNKYRNFIDQDTRADAAYPQGGITEYFNRNKVTIYGAEASAHYKFDSGAHTGISSAYAYGEDDDSGEYIDTIPAFKTVLNVGYAVDDSWGVDSYFTYAMAMHRRESDKQKTPDYATVDLTGWYQPVESVTIQAGVYNLFDETYYDSLDIPASTTLPKEYFSQPGRTFKVSATVKF